MMSGLNSPNSPILVEKMSMNDSNSVGNPREEVTDGVVTIIAGNPSIRPRTPLNDSKLLNDTVDSVMPMPSSVRRARSNEESMSMSPETHQDIKMVEVPSWVIRKGGNGYAHIHIYSCILCS